MSAENRSASPQPLLYCALAAAVMAYGWGYRGTVGHEAGAMVPGALLGLVLCLASGRLDWHRRAAVGGLFGAVGWAWGGSLSYMEQTFFVLSDSLVDVAYGYSVLFFLGALWAGIGGSVLGLAFTEPRSRLEPLARVFTAVCAAFLVVHLYLFFVPVHADFIETFTVRHFHDGDWLPATLALIVAAVYWVLRPSDRSAAVLFLCGALAWWVGYLAFTKFGGLRLGPLHRSESWGGVVGILAVLLAWHIRRRNRAALMLGLYGILGGGFGFSLAVFLRHPVVTKWGPFADWPLPQWRIAEDSFGLFMGVAIALGALRLLRSGLTPPQEDTPRPRLDVYAAFVVLVALVWINFRRHAAPIVAASNKSEALPFLGIPAWGWLVFAGALATLPVLYILFRYLRGDRSLVPPTAFGKGAVLALLLLWITVAGHLSHEIPNAAEIVSHLLLWVPAGVASMLLLMGFAPAAPRAVVPSTLTADATDSRWNVGLRYGFLWTLVPAFILAISFLSMGMQEGPMEGMGRQRFGPNAYWRQTARLMGTWQAVGVATEIGGAPVPPATNLPYTSLSFDEYRNVTATLPSGETEADHQWFLKNQYTWLRWHGKTSDHPDRTETPIEFRDRRLYIADTSGTHYIVLERTGD